MADIVLVEGNNELNVSLTPVGVAEFVYVSELRRWWTGGADFDTDWSVDIQNIGEMAGDCTLRFYDRMKSPYEPYEWSGFSLRETQKKTIQPGEVVTFSGRSWVGPYTYQFMVKSPAGVLLNPTHPLEFTCYICQWLYGIETSFATREELDAHYAQEHPQYA